MGGHGKDTCPLAPPNDKKKTFDTKFDDPIGVGHRQKSQAKPEKSLADISQKERHLMSTSTQYYTSAAARVDPPGNSDCHATGVQDDGGAVKPTLNILPPYNK